MIIIKNKFEHLGQYKNQCKAHLTFHLSLFIFNLMTAERTTLFASPLSLFTFFSYLWRINIFIA